jgi:hypothetical protein
MEITCTRCHQPVEAENCYCPTCGLPQLQYSAENVPGQAPAERWTEPIRDASIVDWKRAMPLVLTLAVPAGILCPLLYPMGFLGLFLMAIASYWVVVLYLRSQRPAWITIGAGARIGLVTGLIVSWLAAGFIGVGLFVMRAFAGQGNGMDQAWQDSINKKISPDILQQWQSAGLDMKALLFSPEGRAGIMLSGILTLAGLLLIFAVLGGALGARSTARARRTQV